jgi:hypothetical protein
MALYNLSEFITTVKENVGIKDLPLPVTDQEIVDHFDRVTLTDFSVVYPRVETVYLGQDNLTEKAKASMNTFYEYKIPKFVYEGTTILSVTKIDVARPNGYSDFFIPNANWSTPDAVISAMADVRMAAGVASALAKAPTLEFVPPNIIKVFNGWAGAIYEFEILLKHDLSLATVPPGAIYNLRRLAELDLEWFLYNKLKRKENLEVGVGSIQLRIDDWSSSRNDREELLRSWREESNLDFSHISRY